MFLHYSIHATFLLPLLSTDNLENFCSSVELIIDFFKNTFYLKKNGNDSFRKFNPSLSISIYFVWVPLLHQSWLCPPTSIFYHLKISHEIRLWMNYLCNKSLLSLQQTSFILFPSLMQNWEFIYIEILYWFIVMFYFYAINRRTENVYINQMLPGDIYVFVMAASIYV